MDKREVITALKDIRLEFMEAIEGLPPEAMTDSPINEGWSLKDIIVHITLWEAELVKLLWQVEQGEKPSTLHFSKPDVDALNEQWHQQNRERPLDIALADFQGVRKQTIRRVEALKDSDLTNPRRYPWLRDLPLWKWIANDSFEHEAEHISQICSWKARTEAQT
jgi:uncharacterized damage-inducible protein DinB